MKYVIVLTTGLLFGMKTYAQQPVFLSPYKSGKPVPENQKDYSTPQPINLLVDGSKKTNTVPAQNKVPDNTPVTGTPNKPVMLNAKKEPKN
jgi:hypothetical protein